MAALNGKGLGGKPDSPDPRDHLWGYGTWEFPRPELPPSVDLRKLLPPVWDQGETNACGGMAGAALMAYLMPGYSFSALQIYYNCRVLEDDVKNDNGVETRNVVKVMNDPGVISSQAWPFNPSNVLQTPPVTNRTTIKDYARLISGDDMLQCLAMRRPFILGFKMPASLDDDDIARVGIMKRPDLKKDPIIGGHDVLVVGFDRTFKDSPFFEVSGIDPELVDDTMLLIRNSWGPKWSPNFRGHFWMPLSYAVNPSTGGDAWTARI